MWGNILSATEPFVRTVWRVSVSQSSSPVRIRHHEKNISSVSFLSARTKKRRAFTVLSPVWHSRRDTKGSRPDRSLQEADERAFLRLSSPPWQLPSLRLSPLKNVAGDGDRLLGDGQVRDTQICVTLTPRAKQYKHTMKEGMASLGGCPGGWLRH